ncbi:IS21-like element helper ATPase IstB [Myroides odoratimimus]|uniref:IS21-like element helper ATPase IstB n=1 Tax=Myroides TaxID=76831 RepID=UPI002097F205|nr:MULTISPECIES: IS21-like element helper ATPase IstB [Myroides]MCO7723995.1 IS21-like element helper ATPase IstB [Myroides odoratimimus]MDM1529106.1 ATP-binding protein [Myroides odoratimimus]
MDNNQTIEKLKAMRLNDMATLHSRHLKDNTTTSFTIDEYIALLTDHEYENRQNRKVERLIKQANFRQNASIADINYTHHRDLDKNMFSRLATLDFMLKKQNIIITGASGVGKSYLAQALGYQACLMEHKVLYFNTANLFNLLKSSKIDGTYQREMKRVLKCDLLILDDFGLQPFDNLIREVLFDIVDQRYNRASIILSSQIPVSAWYPLIGENTIADAVLDRIVNSSHRIELNGDSMRKTNF